MMPTSWASEDWSHRHKYYSSTDIGLSPWFMVYGRVIVHYFAGQI